MFGRDPDHAVPSDKQVICSAKFLSPRNFFPGACPEHRDPAKGGGPDGSVSALRDPFDGPGWNAGCVGLDPAVVDLRNAAAVVADPDVTGGGHEQIVDHLGDERGSADRPEGREPDAVEAIDPFAGGEPKVALGGLRDLPDRRGRLLFQRP